MPRHKRHLRARSLASLEDQVHVALRLGPPPSTILIQALGFAARPERVWAQACSAQRLEESLLGDIRIAEDPGTDLAEQPHLGVAAEGALEALA